MTLPKDPVMLLSVINTALRDHYSSLQMLADEEEIDMEFVIHTLSSIDYVYDEKTNQFI